MRATFSAEERLKNRKSIEVLFKTGNRIIQFPVKILWSFSGTKSNYPARAGFAVPVKRIKSAVLRNRTKRMMRETYRKNKGILYAALTKQNKNIHLMIIFTGNEPDDLAKTGNKIISAINRLIGDVTNRS